jgi:uncharacterized protein involved in exopolysaccharide biosynthesis
MSTANNVRPTYGQLWQDVKKHRRLFYKVLPLTFVIIAFITLCIPNYYNCTVMLAPELSGNKSTSSLANIASSFGLNIGSGNTGSEALFPTLYPDLMNSVVFRASLFPIRVRQEDDDTTMTYYDYLHDHQRAPWWSAAMKGVTEAVGSLFKGDEKDASKRVNPFKLTKEQYNVVKDMEKKVVCDVDKKTLVITINVTDQDPLVAATLADSVQQRLQQFITDYRTRKARIDLEYNQKLYREAEERYEKARRQYAAYADANRNVLFEHDRTERTKLENAMQLQYQTFSQVTAQLRMAEAKVQEDTPAFTTLQPATVPVKKSGPKRAQACLIFLFLAFILTTLFAIHREGHLIPFFLSDDDDE